MNGIRNVAASSLLFVSSLLVSGAAQPKAALAAAQGQVAFIQHKTCSICEDNCYRIYELMGRECMRKKSSMAKNLCWSIANEEHGRCRKKCNHEED